MKPLDTLARAEINVGELHPVDIVAESAAQTFVILLHHPEHILLPDAVKYRRHRIYILRQPPGGRDIAHYFFRQLPGLEIKRPDAVEQVRSRVFYHEIKLSGLFTYIKFISFELIFFPCFECHDTNISVKI